MKRSLALAVNGVVRPARRMTRAPCVTGLRGARYLTSGEKSEPPRGINTSNPFEIKFHVDNGSSVGEGANDPVSISNLSFEDEIELFHSEMGGVFGTELEEFRDDGAQQSSTPTTPADHTHGMSVGTTASVATTPIEAFSFRDALSAEAPSMAVDAPTVAPLIKQQPPVGGASVLLIQGPCTYVHDGWVGSKDRWSANEVKEMVERVACAHGLPVAQHHSNHEGQILDWLLSTSPGDKIILNWNGRLADSPVVYRALDSIRAFVVILTPLDVALGPLPSSVKGVIAGLGTRSLELAIQVCK